MPYIRTLALFVVAGLAEIGGGWLVWKWLRDGKSLWLGLLGRDSLCLWHDHAQTQLEAPHPRNYRNPTGDKLQAIWRDFPHTIPESPQAVEAGQCAFDQSKFWEYHDLLYERAPALSQSDLEGYATQVGLDAARFKTCLETHQDQAKVAHDLQDALGRHLPGTPALLVNNRPLIGGQPCEYFKGLMDAVLAGGT
jgi:hypothetical protein